MRLRRRTLGGAALLVLAAGAAPRASAQTNASVHVEELTSNELRDRVSGGATTVLVPIGGTEQNGPHMALGKHNVRVRLLAGLIAQRLGNALVAPVMAYVPEGAIEPPSAHMRWAGTISIPEAAFEAMLEGTSRSFRRHGLRDIVLLGDHGGYEQNLLRVAERLNREWQRQPGARVHALSEYYRASVHDFSQLLAARGYTTAEIGSHAGLSDTALTLAVDPSLVRGDLLARAPSKGDGVQGDARRATAELGRLGLARIVDASVAAIGERLRAR